MSRITKWKIEKTKVKVVFRLQFHATHVSFTPTYSTFPSIFGLEILNFSWQEILFFGCWKTGKHNPFNLLFELENSNLLLKQYQSALHIWSKLAFKLTVLRICSKFSWHCVIYTLHVYQYVSAMIDSHLSSWLLSGTHVFEWMLVIVYFVIWFCHRI